MGDTLTPRETYALFGWTALLDGLRLINAKDPTCQAEIGDCQALVEFVDHRRDFLLHHHLPGFRLDT